MGTLYNGLRKAKRAERRLERGLKKVLKPKTPQGGKAASEYVHPWDEQDLGNPSIVDELNKQHCCGCGACYNICPTDAIAMEEDEEGFLYPAVSHDLCISCGKCVKACPSYNEQPANDVVDICYATISDSEDVREKSSSGGLFSQIAEYAFSRNGVVFGAAYVATDKVAHIGVENEEDLDKLRRSKYVQSSTERTYSEVKELLDAGRFVLYSGCPCQVAGLYSFLGGDHENLLTVDLICHGSPSPGLFRRYLKENYPDDQIEEVNFRDKSAYGWSTHMNVYFENRSPYREVCGRDPYYRMFLRCLAMRPFCSVCKFTRLPRVADLSLGDWWGIEKFDSSLNDGKGTSLLLVNNEKGEQAFMSICPNMKRCEPYPLSDARPRNYTIDRPFKAHPARKRFFELLEYQSFNKAAISALDYHYDVGIFGLWYGENYGSMLTYYGLRETIADMGYSSVMIENPLSSERGFSLEPHLFANRNGYYITKLRPISQMGELNGICDTFLLGSDQLWNPGLSRPYRFAYFLDFVSPNNKRIAYGTSFGKDTHSIDETYRTRSAYELRKFDALSVRDDFSGKLLKERYGGLVSEKVLDPALLCDPARYDELADHAEPLQFLDGGDFDSASQDYLFAYILDPTEATRSALAKISEQTGKEILLALDYGPKHRENRSKLFEGSESQGIRVLDVPTCEQWLAAIRGSSAVLTDSFHGTIFAYVFKRNFVSVPNAKRGAKRFSDLLETLGLQDRTVNGLAGNENAICEMLDSEIDYKQSNKRWRKERDKSYAWLKDALSKPKEVHTYRSYKRIETQ